MRRTSAITGSRTAAVRAWSTTQLNLSWRERELHAETRQDRNAALEFKYADRVRRQRAEDKVLALSFAHAAQLERLLNQRSAGGHPRTHELHKVLGEEKRL